MKNSGITGKAEMKDLNVLLISLVDQPANKRHIIYKSANAKFNNDGTIAAVNPEGLSKTEKYFEVEKQFVIINKDEEKRLVYGIVYTPVEPDTYEDFMTAEEIEKSLHCFMKRSNTHSIDTQHNLQVEDGVYIVETWIVREADALFPDDVGAWAICVKVENDDVWESVKKGEFTGFSLYGFAKKEKAAEQKKSFFKSAKEFLTKDKSVEVLKQSFNEHFQRLNMSILLDALTYTFWDIWWSSEDLEEKKAQMQQACDELKSKIALIAEVEKSVVAKAGKVLSDANRTKVKDAIEALQAVLDAAEKSKEEKVSKNKNKDLQMTDEIKKAVDKATAELNQKITDLETKVTEKDAKITELENTSKGSTQGTQIPGPTDSAEKKSADIPWTSMTSSK